MDRLTYLKSQNADYIEELFSRYLQDPDSVDESWRYFFDGLDLGQSAVFEEAHLEGVSNGKANGAGAGQVTTSVALSQNTKNALESALENKIRDLTRRYRQFGKWVANVNPLEPPKPSHPQLDPSKAGLSTSELTGKAAQILAALKETYCGSVGADYMFIENEEVRNWIQTQVETTKFRPAFDKKTKVRILHKLTETEAFERYLHTRYVAQKRFSVEGGDSLIPMLDGAIDQLGASGASDVVIGMAHRGRLNVLTNLIGKKYEAIFSEFEGNYDKTALEGDVKYHLGFSSDYTTLSGHKVHVSLASNPSHLEFVNPVVEGLTRAKQELKASGDPSKLSETRKKVIPILIHGDAAFAGQGVVYETLQMSGLPGYSTGGTIHVIINNQVGFTTDPIDARTSAYSTDLAKMMDCPVFHVNGDDAEACYYVSTLAAQFRQMFQKDVFIDLICYRKYGHNEGDEPSFTQPLMYKKIKEHPSPREIYAKQLVNSGVVSQAEVQDLLNKVNETLTKSHELAKSGKTYSQISVFEGEWKGLRFSKDSDFDKSIDTTVDEKTLKTLGKKLAELPQGFTVHPKLARFLESRGSAIESASGIDWGNGEALAFATCLWEGHSIRLSGQDVERGTFSHRHSVLKDYQSGQTYVPLNNLKQGQPLYTVYNSLLSETGCLGFDYGYSVANPKALTIWEAQFGDFANGAQVIIDQFIASSETKWLRLSGIVLLLPHGFEGQGPEHSSARLERFLQLCAKQNMQVCYFTTPAQLFHGLRRQVKRDFRKPLVVMSPKSLLRHPKVVSSLEDFTKKSFQEILDDSEVSAKKVKRLIFCTGKIYYDLHTGREKLFENSKSDPNIAIVRIEQLYPWPKKQLEKVLKKYESVNEVCWVQEEPRNMGAWYYLADRLTEEIKETLGEKVSLKYVGRARAAAPAVGSPKVHEKEQKSIIEEALK